METYGPSEILGTNGYEFTAPGIAPPAAGCAMVAGSGSGLEYVLGWSARPVLMEPVVPSSSNDQYFAADRTWKSIPPINAGSIQSALGYTPANRAGDVFTGNVGIGSVSTPQAWLHLRGADSEGILIESTGSWPEIDLIGNSATNDHRAKIVLNGNTGDLQFRLLQGANPASSANSRMTITQAGDINGARHIRTGTTGVFGWTDTQWQRVAANSTRFAAADGTTLGTINVFQTQYGESGQGFIERSSGALNLGWGFANRVSINDTSMAVRVPIHFPFAAEGNIGQIFMNGVAGLDIFNTRTLGTGDVRISSSTGEVQLCNGLTATPRVVVRSNGATGISVTGDLLGTYGFNQNMLVIPPSYQIGWASSWGAPYVTSNSQSIIGGSGAQVKVQANSGLIVRNLADNYTYATISGNEVSGNITGRIRLGTGTEGIYGTGGGNIVIDGGNSDTSVLISPAGMHMWANRRLTWANTNNVGGLIQMSTASLGITQASLGVLEINNGTAFSLGGALRDLSARNGTFNGLVNVVSGSTTAQIQASMTRYMFPSSGYGFGTYILDVTNAGPATLVIANTHGNPAFIQGAQPISLRVEGPIQYTTQVRDSLGIGIRSQSGFLTLYGFNTVGSNAPAASVNQDGVRVVGRMAIGNADWAAAFGSEQLHVRPASNSSQGIVVRGFSAGQTGNLQEWQLDTSQVVANVRSDGTGVFTPGVVVGAGNSAGTIISDGSLGLQFYWSRNLVNAANRGVAMALNGFIPLNGMTLGQSGFGWPSLFMDGGAFLQGSAGNNLTISGTTTFSGNVQMGNGILFDSTRRIFGAGQIVYQSNATANQHLFANEIGDSLTSGAVVQIHAGGGGVGPGVNLLNLTNQLSTVVASISPTGAATFSGNLQQGFNTSTPSARFRMLASGQRVSEVGDGAGAWASGYREDYNGGTLRFGWGSALTPIQSIAAAATDAASTQTLANSIRTILLNLGLVI